MTSATPREAVSLFAVVSGLFLVMKAADCDLIQRVDRGLQMPSRDMQINRRVLQRRCPSSNWIVRRSVPASSMWVAKLCLNVCGPILLLSPARSAASWHACRTTLSELGCSSSIGGKRLGKRYRRGLRFEDRQYSRNASSSFGVAAGRDLASPYPDGRGSASATYRDR